MFTIVRCIETSPPLDVVNDAHEEILNRYIMFGMGICAKYQSRDEQFPKPIGEGNLASRLVLFFANIPHNMIYLFNYTEYYLEHWLNKSYLLFVVFRNILFSLFVTWQLLNTIGRFELFPSAGTMIVFRFVMSDSG